MSDTAPKFRIHYLVPDEAGPIPSGGLVLNTPMGLQRVASPHRLRAACDAALTMSEWNAGTGETWAVTCPGCVQSPEYLANYQPHPGTWQNGEPARGASRPPPLPKALLQKTQGVTIADDGGCCG